MFFKKQKKNSHEIVGDFVENLTQPIRRRWSENDGSPIFKKISADSFQEDFEIPTWTETPSYTLIQPLQTQLWGLIITIAPAILDYLKDNQEQNALFREIQSDLAEKLSYAVSLANALTSIGEGLDKAQSKEASELVSAVFGYLENFFEFESTFSEHKSLATWKRLKTPLASHLNTEQYNKLCHFYMNFSILASICTKNNTKADAILSQLSAVLSGKANKKAAQKVVDLMGQALQCLSTVAKTLNEFFEALR